MKEAAPTLPDVFRRLEPHREALLESWLRVVSELEPAPEGDARAFCTRALGTALDHGTRGDLESLLRQEFESAAARARTGGSFRSTAAAHHALVRCCLPFLREAYGEGEALARSLLLLGELAGRRVEAALLAQEEESGRRLIEAQEQGARAVERAREVAQANEALRRSEHQSRHRAEQIALLSTVAHRIAPILEPERLMEEAAQCIQSRMNHTYVAVIVLDDEGVLVGRWAGRAGVGRRSAGRAQGPPGGIIGRAIRLRAPQVAGDVAHDPDYHADVAGTRSEMVIPLLEGGLVLGAIDFQSERSYSFDLDAVAAGEALAEFLVVALRNARLFDELKNRGGDPRRQSPLLGPEAR